MLNIKHLLDKKPCNYTQNDFLKFKTLIFSVDFHVEYNYFYFIPSFNSNK